MSALRPGWAEVALGDLASFVTSGSRGWARYYSEEGPAFVRVGNVPRGRIKLDVSDLQRVKPPHGAEGERTRLHEGDVLVTITADLGRVCVFSAEVGDAYINQHVALVRLSETNIADYVAWFLASPDGQDELLGRDKGTTKAGLGLDDIRSVGLPLPPLAEQRRLVAKLNALTARTARARADLDRVSSMAARYKKAILAKAICGELTSEWRHGRHLSPVTPILAAIREGRRSDRRLSRRSRVSAVPAFDLPPSWAWVSPDEIADDETYSIGIGPFGSNLVQADYRANGVRLIFVRDIRRERFDADGARYVTQDKAAELHQHTVTGGEVLITKMGSPPGDTALYPLGAGLAVITADCVKLKPHAHLALPQFLTFSIRSDVVKTQLAEITAGVAQQKISLERFRDIALPVPPLEEQQEIVRRIARAFAEVDRLTAEATAAHRLLDRLDQAILAKAFRGELVPQDPADEPASALLDRIRAERAATPSLKRPRAARGAAATRRPKETSMTKSRLDSDVKFSAYLAGLLRGTTNGMTTESLYNASELPVADFYKQLDWEIQQGLVIEAGDLLRAA